jgi:hypothetical protein
MGVYNCNIQELKDVLFEALDNIEGDFDSKILKKALKETAKEYKNTTDREGEQQ